MPFKWAGLHNSGGTGWISKLVCRCGLGGGKGNRTGWNGTDVVERGITVIRVGLGRDQREMSQHGTVTGDCG